MNDERFALALRGFGVVGILAVLVILAGNLLFAPLSALLVLGWAQLSRTPWREIGYVRPRSWINGIAIGIVFGVAFKLVMKSVVMPLFGAPSINPTYHYLSGNAAVAGMFAIEVIIKAGFGEETLFRGYMFERLGKLFGGTIAAKVAIVLLTSAFFGVLHYTEQGWPGVQQAAIVGLVFGTIYSFTRQLWMLMCAHAAFDLTAIALIYWDLELPVAQFIFK